MILLKKFSYHWPTLILACLMPITLMAQYESTGFTATGSAGLSTTSLHDYQALGINPANIGTGESYNVAFGFLEGGFSLHSRALSRSNLSSMLLSNDSITIPSNLSHQLSEDFVNRGFAVDLNFMVGGVAFQAFKRVALALKIDVVSNFRTRFNDFGSKFFFEGYRHAAYFDQYPSFNNGDTVGIALKPQNIYELMQGSYLKGSFTVPVTLGTSFRLKKGAHYQLHFGAGMKYVFGIALLDFEAKNGVINGYGSYNETVPPSIEVVQTHVTPTGSWSPAGRGIGLDVGCNYQYKDWLDVGVSITDIGEMTWSGNVFSIKNKVLDTTHYNGADNFKLVEVYESLSDDGDLIHKGNDAFEVAMPAKVRAGVKFSPAEFFSIGLDVILPMNNAPGNLESPYLGMGGSVKIFNIFNLTAGVNYTSDYGFNYPVGFMLRSGENKQYEAGLSSRDMQTIFSQDDPNISYTFGFLRFRF